MPTQEERLTTVEYDLNHFKTETIKAYGDMAMELVMVKGLTEDAVKRLMTLRRALDQQMAEIKQDIHQLQTNSDTHTSLLNEHTKVLGEHTKVLGEHTKVLSEHTTRFDRLETLLTQILARLPGKP
jgi:ABC-type transporter Mla subunit MlaD